VLCALRNPDFLRVFIWHHNFERYLTPVFEHRQPFWFFGAIFIVGILPWLPLLAVAFRGAHSDQQDSSARNSPALFLLCWALFTLLFFSVSQSKLPGYILPAFPPAILLLARGLVRTTEQKAKGVTLLFVSIAAVYPILIFVAGWKLLPTLGQGLTLLSPGPFGGVRAGSEAALIGGGIAAAFALTRKWNCAVCAVATTTAILVLIANQMLLPGLDTMISARPLAAVLSQKYEVKPEEIAVHQLPRAYQYGFDYYFAKELPELIPNNATASVVLFSSGTDIQQSGNFDSGPASRDGKIRWAWRKDRPKRPQRF